MYFKNTSNGRPMTAHYTWSKEIIANNGNGINLKAAAINLGEVAGH